MKMKRFLCPIFAMVLCMIFMPVQTVKAASTTYYVSTSGEDSNAGTSQSAPLETLNQAVTNAEDGDVIVILDSAQAVDPTSTDAPLVIDKQLTISGDAATLPSLSMRAGGIILGADVTFEHLKIGGASFLRPGIAANGHTLTLRNVHQDETLRPLQIYGGTFFDYNENPGSGTNYGENHMGTQSNINIIGGSFEGIYAGSTNGGFDLPVNISIHKNDPENPDDKYDFSLENGIFVASTVKNPGDTTTSGQIPSVDTSESLPLLVNVAVNDNAAVKRVSGVFEGHTVDLTVNGVGTYSFAVDNIDSVTVSGGTFVPEGYNLFDNTSVPDITLTGTAENKATLDLSGCGSVYVGDFVGSDNGILVLSADSAMTINGTLSGGTTEFRTGGGNPWSSEEIPGYSGMMTDGAAYITMAEGAVDDGGSFVISNPYPAQMGTAFTEDSGAANGWTVAVDSEYYVGIDSFELTDTSVFVSYNTANTSGVELAVSTAFTDDSSVIELGLVPFSYTVKYTDSEGATATYTSDGFTEQWTCEALGMDFWGISSYASDDDLVGTHKIYACATENCVIEAGTYDIEITAATTNGIVTDSVTLTILPKSEVGETLAGYSVSLDGNINVNFHFTFEEALAADENAYVLFTLPNGTKSCVYLKDIAKNETTGHYVFTCEVAAKEMASTIKAQVVKDENTKSGEYAYSVKEYAEHILKNEGTAYSSEVCKLVKAMLNYGANAQQYFGKDTDKLANTYLNTEEKDLSDVLDAPDTYLGSYQTESVTNAAIGSFTRANLVLESDTVLRVYFKPAEGVSVEELTFTLNNKEITPVKSGSEYLLKVADIKAQKLNESMVFAVSVREDENMTPVSLSYNPLSYCYRILTRTDVDFSQELKNVAAALYKYHVNAADFVDDKTANETE